MSIADEIERLQRLRESGALTEEEFAAAKATVLTGGQDDSQSEDITRELAGLRHDNRIAQLDKAWELERENFKASGKDGHRHLPTKGGSMAGGIIAAVGGIVWIGIASSMHAPGMVIVLGVLFVVIGVGVSLHGFSKANAYEQEQERYRRERERLLRDKA